MPRPQHVLPVTLFFVAASTFYTYPLLFGLRTSILTGLGDYLGEAALVGWNAHQLLRSPLHLFDSQFYYPHSNTIAYGQSLFFPGLLALPLWALTGQALLVTNVLLFLALVLSGLFMYCLAFSLTGRLLPSLLAGVVFAYFPNRLEHLGQFTVQNGFLLPLVVWAFYRFLLEQRWRDLALVVLGIWGQILSTMYYGLALGFLLLGLLVACVLLRPRLVSARLVARAAVGLLVLGAALAPFLKPYLDLHRELGLARDVLQAEWFGMDLLSILDPGYWNRLYGGHLFYLARSEGGLFPGFVVLGLCAWAVWRGRRQPTEATPGWVRAAVRALLAGLVVCLAAIVLVPWTGGVSLHVAGMRLFRARDITLPLILLPALALAWVALEGQRRRDGPLTPREWVITLLFHAIFMYELTLAPSIQVAGTPWGTALFRWVFFYVPGGSAFRAPGRWSLVFVVPLALLAAFGARAVAESLRGRLGRLVAALLLVGVMAECVIQRIDWDRHPDPAPVYRWLAAEPGDFAVLELPTYTGYADALYMLRSTVHWKRLVNGAIGFVPATVNELVQTSEPFDPAAFMVRLQSIYPLRYLLVHPQLMTAERVPEHVRWQGLRSTPMPGLRLLRSFGPDDVYEVLGTPQAGVELVRYFSSDFVARHAGAEFAVAFTGDPEVTQWVDVAFNGRPVARVEADGRWELPLAPPYRVADRNELRLRQRYELRPGAVADRTPYAIGRTGAFAPADIAIVSAGQEHGDTASIRINRVELAPNRRGYNVVVLEPRTGRVVTAEVFDTFASGDESRRLARFVEALGPGTVVAVAVRDEASRSLTDEGVAALRSLGAAQDIRGKYRVSHLVVGVKGARPGEALEAVGADSLRALVGRERALPVTLESFELR